MNHFSLKDTKLQNALRATKARVDTQWKKTAATTTTTTTTNGTTAATKSNAVTTREVQKTESTAAAGGQRKILTRSKSVRLGATNKVITGVGVTNKTTAGVGATNKVTTGLGQQAVGQTKTKTLTTKVIENKVQQVEGK